jgi:hypothetical protein
VPVGAAGKIFVGYRMDTQLRKSSGTPGCDCASLAKMLLRNVCSVSRRDNTDRSLARSAWDSVTQRSRPAGYGVISAVVRTDLKRREIPLGLAAPRSYRTLRDGSFEGRFPRHFVPGYDRTVPT